MGLPVNLENQSTYLIYNQNTILGLYGIHIAVNGENIVNCCELLPGYWMLLDFNQLSIKSIYYIKNKGLQKLSHSLYRQGLRSLQQKRYKDVRLLNWQRQNKVQTRRVDTNRLCQLQHFEHILLWVNWQNSLKSQLGDTNSQKWNTLFKSLNLVLQ